MRICAIISEYNPFHNGHFYQISKTRQETESTHAIAIMGGNFLQRGDIASFPKHIRAKAALLGGIDLVLELSAPFAMSSAEYFASGAVRLANALGCVDILSFGSECGAISALEKISHLLSESVFQEAVDRYLKNGISFPSARQRAVAELCGPDTGEILSGSNDTLAIEYIRALQTSGSSIRPFAVPRTGAAHDSTDSSGAFASATSLRKGIHAGGVGAIRNYVPAAAYAVCRDAAAIGQGPANHKKIETALLYRLRQMSKSDFAALPDVTEGLENRLVSAARSAVSVEEFLFKAKTKRYTLSRIRRILFYSFAGMKKELVKQAPPYVRVLGFNQKGAEILKLCKNTASLPVSSRLIDLSKTGEKAKAFADLEARCTDLYQLSLPSPTPCGIDYTTNPVILI